MFTVRARRGGEEGLRAATCVDTILHAGESVPVTSTPCHTYILELEMKVREVFTIMEKAPSRTFSWFQSSSFTFKNL